MPNKQPKPMTQREHNPQIRIKMKKKTKKKTFKDFKEFLNEECGTLSEYKAGKYDRKIYNWFKNLNPPDPKRT